MGLHGSRPKKDSSSWGQKRLICQLCCPANCPLVGGCRKNWAQVLCGGCHRSPCALLSCLVQAPALVQNTRPFDLPLPGGERMGLALRPRGSPDTRTSPGLRTHEEALGKPRPTVQSVVGGHQGGRQGGQGHPHRPEPMAVTELAQRYVRNGETCPRCWKFRRALPPSIGDARQVTTHLSLSSLTLRDTGWKWMTSNVWDATAVIQKQEEGALCLGVGQWAWPSSPYLAFRHLLAASEGAGEEQPVSEGWWPCFVNPAVRSRRTGRLCCC